MAFNVLTQTAYGQMLCNRNDQNVGRLLIEYGEFSGDECDFLLSILKPDDVVIEVGANIGALTVPIAQKVKRVIAYEPQRLVFQTLCANLALNSIQNVYPIRDAVGAKEEWVAMPELDPNEPYNFGGVEMRTGAGIVRVSQLRGECSFLKLDCEGMEGEVLDGAEEMIRQYRPTIYMENDRPEKRDALIKQIESLGYTWEWHYPPLFRANNYRGNTVNVFGNIVSANMICYPR